MIGVLDGALYGAEGVPHDALVTGQEPEQAQDVPAPGVHADLRQVRALHRVLGYVVISKSMFYCQAQDPQLKVQIKLRSKPHNSL